MSTPLNDPDAIRSVLTTPGTWAVVGLSSRPERVAHRIAGWLKQHLGHTIIPIHPSAETVFGEQGYARLADVPDGTRVDVVDCFVRSDLVGAVVDEAIEQRDRLGIRMVWLQLGVIDEEAAARAAEAGLQVVMDTCPKIEYPLLILGGPDLPVEPPAVSAPRIPTGDLRATKTGHDLVLVRRFGVGIPELWSYLTESELCERWYARWSGDPQAGDRVTLTWVGEEGEPTSEVEIRSCEAPAQLELVTLDENYQWHLSALLYWVHEESLLEFIHHDVDPTLAREVGPGWEFYLDRLAAVIAGTEVPEWSDRYNNELQGHYGRGR